MENASPILEETLPGGAMRSLVLRRGTALRLEDLDGGANVSALFFNADDPLERYNMPDTLKAQHTAYLTRGHVLYSDMGRVLCSVVEDGCGWHDTLCGVTTARLTEEKYGPSSYQKDRNAFHRNGRDNFLIELGKHGLGKRDIAANVNFFSKVTVDDDGGLHFLPGHSRPGAFVTLRAEMDVLVVLSNTPHPLDPSTTWKPGPVGLRVLRLPAPGPDDFCRNSRPENVRGFQNTELLFR
jgi:urea carboxylase-associated protein 2